MMRRIKSFLLQNRGYRQTITKNTLWLGFSQLGSRLIRSSIVIYAARVMGASEYGIFSYALGLAGFFTVLSDIGVGSIMTRESAQRPEQRSYYFSTSFWIKFVLLTLTTIIILAVMPYVTKISAVQTLLPFIALLVIFDGLRDFSLGFFRALEQMEWEAIVTVATNLIITASGFVILYLSSAARTFMASYALSAGVGTLIAVIIIRKEFYKIFSHSKRDLVGPIITSAIPIAFSSALGIFMLNTDFFMLGWWQTSAQIGYYSAGQKIVQLIFTMPSVISTAIFPTLMRLIAQKDHSKVKSLMEKVMTFIFFMAIPMVVGGVILGKPIIELIYSRDYLPAVMNFQVLMFAILLTFPSVLITIGTFAYNKQGQMTKYLFWSAVSNAIFDAIFIPIFGFIGSSFSTIIALTINIGLGWLLLKKVNNFYTVRHLPKIIAASLMMGALSFILNKFGLNVILNIILSIGVYFASLLLLKERTLKEIALVFQEAES